jgi:hypothetical protein
VIYELRRYQLTTHPGVREALNEHMVRMMPVFERHGIKMVGGWDSLIGGSLPFHAYILKWADLGDRMPAFDAFYADPEYQQSMVRMRDEAGQVGTEYDVSILRPAAYSPLD